MEPTDTNRDGTYKNMNDNARGDFADVSRLFDCLRPVFTGPRGSENGAATHPSALVCRRRQSGATTACQGVPGRPCRGSGVSSGPAPPHGGTSGCWGPGTLPRHAGRLARNHTREAHLASNSPSRSGTRQVAELSRRTGLKLPQRSCRIPAGRQEPAPGPPSAGPHRDARSPSLSMMMVERASSASLVRGHPAILSPRVARRSVASLCRSPIVSIS